MKIDELDNAAEAAAKKKARHDREKSEPKKFIRQRDFPTKNQKVLESCTRQFQSWEELAAYFQVDLDIWEPTQITTNAWDSMIRDQETDLEWEDGIATGTTKRKRLPIIPTLMQIKVIFKRKPGLARSKQVVAQLIADARKGAPKLPRLAKRSRRRRKLTLEISIADPHIGLLNWGRETGTNWDLQIAKKAYYAAVQHLLESGTSTLNVTDVLFVMGHDFFNVNSALNTSVHGTPQDEDVRYKKTFTEARRMVCSAIDLCRQVAPVNVVVVPGNHDEERIFYFGDAIDCFYHKCRDVNVDNTPALQKYIRCGCTLIGMTHGASEKHDALPLLMATDAKADWAATNRHEWHVGHLHTAKQYIYKARESHHGVAVRFLPSICPRSAWARSKGFIDVREAVALAWDHNDGLTAEFTYQPRWKKERLP